MIYVRSRPVLFFTSSSFSDDFIQAAVSIPYWSPFNECWSIIFSNKFKKKSTILGICVFLGMCIFHGRISMCTSFENNSIFRLFIMSVWVSGWLSSQECDRTHPYLLTRISFLLALVNRLRTYWMCILTLLFLPFQPARSSLVIFPVHSICKHKSVHPWKTIWRFLKGRVEQVLYLLDILTT